MDMDKNQYQAYLRSDHWRQTRQQAILRAGHRCEFKHYHLDRIESCNRTQNLEVHHKHYKSLGNEQPDDLMVLCEYHHKIVELMKKECTACGEPVLDRDGAEVTLSAIKEFGDFVSLRSYVGSLCSACQHCWDKD